MRISIGGLVCLKVGCVYIELFKYNFFGLDSISLFDDISIFTNLSTMKQGQFLSRV